MIPPIGDLRPDDDYRGIIFPANTAQPIFADEHDGVIQLRKQDNKLSLELDNREWLEAAFATLRWASKSRLVVAEMEQAADILERKVKNG